MGSSMQSMMGGMTGGMMSTSAGVNQGKALLSWRVALLPYLGEQELYRQFRLNEPWDSTHNKALLKRMPKIFAPPGATNAAPYTTYYQVFVGPGAVFEKHQSLPFPASITDGTSNTLLIVEAGNAVPWTKPEDLHFAPDEPLPELGGLFPGIFNAVFVDGAVYPLSKKADPAMIRRAIVRDDGQVLDMARLKAPGSRREVILREQNDRLRRALDQQEKNLRELQAERDLLNEIEDDSTTTQLKKENEELGKRLRQLQQQAERMKEDIQRLKQVQKRDPERN
jgi:hypothetical protein